MFGASSAPARNIPAPADHARGQRGRHVGHSAQMQRHEGRRDQRAGRQQDARGRGGCGRDLPDPDRAGPDQPGGSRRRPGGPGLGARRPARPDGRRRAGQHSGQREREKRRGMHTVAGKQPAQQQGDEPVGQPHARPSTQAGEVSRPTVALRATPAPARAGAEQEKRRQTERHDPDGPSRTRQRDAVPEQPERAADAQRAAGAGGTAGVRGPERQHERLDHEQASGGTGPTGEGPGDGDRQSPVRTAGCWTAGPRPAAQAPQALAEVDQGHLSHADTATQLRTAQARRAGRGRGS